MERIMRSVHERREQVHERARKVEGRSSKISRSSRFLWNVSVRTFLRIYPQRYRNSVTQLESSRIRIIERDTISISRSNRSRTKPPPRFNLRGSWMCVTESWSLLWDLAWFVETEHEGESNGRKAVLMENCVSNQEGIVATIETIDIPPEIWGYESKFATFVPQIELKRDIDQEEYFMKVARHRFKYSHIRLVFKKCLLDNRRNK